MTMISTNCPAAYCAPARLPLGARIARALDLWRQRRALAALDERALRDIGLTRAEAEAEARRPLWDAPENWRC